MGTVPIVIFRGLPQSRAQGLGELGPPHFPGYRPTWSLSKLYRLYNRLDYLGEGRAVEYRVLVHVSGAT